MCPTNDSCSIDNVDSGPLTERPESTLDVILEKHRSVVVGEHRKRQSKLVDQTPGFGHVVWSDADDLGPATSELFVLVTQPREMPTAKSSATATQKYQDDRGATVV